MTQSAVGLEIMEVVPAPVGFLGYFFGDGVGDNEKRVMVAQYSSTGLFVADVADFSLAGGFDAFRGGTIMPSAQDGLQAGSVVGLTNQHATHLSGYTLKSIDPFASVENTLDLTAGIGAPGAGNFQTTQLHIAPDGQSIYWLEYFHASPFAGITIRLRKSNFDFSTISTVSTLTPASPNPPASPTSAIVGLEDLGVVFIIDDVFHWQTREVWSPGPTTYEFHYDFPLSGGGSRTSSTNWLQYADSLSHHPTEGVPIGTAWYGYGGKRAGPGTEVAIWKALNTGAEPTTHWPNTGLFKLDEDDDASEGQEEWARNVWTKDGAIINVYCTHTQKGAGNPPTQETGRVLTDDAESPGGTPDSNIVFQIHPSFNAQFPAMAGPNV